MKPYYEGDGITQLVAMNLRWPLSHYPAFVKPDAKTTWMRVAVVLWFNERKR